MCVRWPVREGMKTIRQIADEIGVSKQAVYKRYKGKLYTVCAPYAHTEQGVLYLSEQAETLIKQDFLRDGCPNGSHTDTHTERSIGAVPEQSQEAGVVAILQATIDTLQGQLSVKDNGRKPVKKISASATVLLTLKVEVQSPYNRITISYNRKGHRAFAVFLLSIFVGKCRRAVSDMRCRSPPLHLDFLHFKNSDGRYLW